MKQVSPLTYWRALNDASSHMLKSVILIFSVSFFVGVFDNWMKNFVWHEVRPCIVSTAVGYLYI